MVPGLCPRQVQVERGKRNTKRVNLLRLEHLLGQTAQLMLLKVWFSFSFSLCGLFWKGGGQVRGTFWTYSCYWNILWSLTLCLFFFRVDSGMTALRLNHGALCVGKSHGRSKTKLCLNIYALQVHHNKRFCLMIKHFEIIMIVFIVTTRGFSVIHFRQRPQSEDPCGRPQNKERSKNKVWHVLCCVSSKWTRTAFQTYFI